MQNKNLKNYYRSKPQAPVGGYRRFQIGCVFVEYDLFNTTTFIQNCQYMNFHIKELSFCPKLRFCNPYIFCNPMS